jgi:hypothetical protein
MLAADYFEWYQERKIMTDREMLELAAKAAGLHVGFGYAYTESGRYDLYWSHVHHQLAWHDKTAGSEYPVPVFWNPLDDDGDAFRLAVKLGIDVSFPLYRKCDPPTVHAGRYWDPYVSCWYPFEEIKGDDPYAATRRAIVRAAAEIGRNKL